MEIEERPEGYYRQKIYYIFLGIFKKSFNKINLNNI